MHDLGHSSAGVGVGVAHSEWMRMGEMEMAQGEVRKAVRLVMWRVPKGLRRRKGVMVDMVKFFLFGGICFWGFALVLDRR